jgi:DNA-binding MarR family transcriptional regulator
MNTSNIEEFRKHLRVIERGLEFSLKSQTACCGVSLAQCHLLLELGEKGVSSLVDLADRLRLDTSTLSRTADSLVKVGLLSREVDSANRRYIRLSLTAKGRENWTFINKTCNAFYKGLFERFSGAQQKSLLEVIPILASFLDQSVVLRQKGCCSVPRENGKHGKDR